MKAVVPSIKESVPCPGWVYHEQDFFPAPGSVGAGAALGQWDCTDGPTPGWGEFSPQKQTPPRAKLGCPSLSRVCQKL